MKSKQRIQMMMTAFILLWSAGFAQASQTVFPKIKLDRPYVSTGSNQTVHVLIQFNTDPSLIRSPQDRSNLDLGVVVDRSGSMADRGKLAYAKQAVKTMIDLLQPTDTLACVQYDDRIAVLWPSSPVTNTGLYKQLIDSLSPGGSTNLAGGLIMGINQLRQSRTGSIRRVILLSDGLANQGITDRYQIAGIAAEARSHGISVTTMGLGLNYDEDLMQKIADSGGGKYYYIENPSEMARIYRQEMDVLFSMLTRGISIELEMGSAVNSVEVFGYSVENNGSKKKIAMEDFYAGENRSLLLKFDLKPVKEGETAIGTLAMDYLDLGDNQKKRQTYAITVNGTRDGDVVEKNIQKDVAAETLLIQADQEHEEALRLYEAGKVSEAKSRLDSLQQQLAAAPAAADIKVQKKLEALDMEEK